MGVFPRTEPEVAELALIMVEGLAAGQDDFPAPPVPAEELKVSTAVTTNQLVNNQPRGVELGYRAVALNKAGVCFGPGLSQGMPAA